MTVLFGCSMEGEKLPLFFIGKSKNPRCFKNHDLKKENILYGSNKTAWITAILFKNWLTIINDKMVLQNQKIILLLDNASSHKDPELSNVKLIFIPPNTSAIIQPLDMGIIKVLKYAYIKDLTGFIISNFDDNFNCLLKEVSAIKAICWLTKNWEDLNEQII